MTGLGHPRKLLPIIAILLLAATSLALADFEQAMTHFKGRKYVEAAAEFQAMVDQSPEYDGGYFMLGQCFVQMKKMNDAIGSFQKAIDLNGDRFEYHYGLATAYFKQTEFSKTVSALRTAESLAAETQKGSLYKLRGFSYAGLKKWGEAVDDLEKAKQLKSSSDVIDQLGLAYYNLGHQDKAVPLLRQAVQATPTNTGLLVRLTNSLMDLGAASTSDSAKRSNYGEALQVAEKYLKQKPSSFEAQNLVGRAALGAKDYARAVSAFERALERKPDYCYAMVNLGKVHIAQQQWLQAEGVLKRAANCAPRMAVIYESLGFAVQKQKRLPEALDFYKKAHEIKPSPMVSKLIATCEENIRISKENLSMEEQEKAMDDAAKKAEAEFQKELEKRKEWEKRRQRDD